LVLGFDQDGRVGVDVHEFTVDLERNWIEGDEVVAADALLRAKSDTDGPEESSSRCAICGHEVQRDDLEPSVVGIPCFTDLPLFGYVGDVGQYKAVETGAGTVRAGDLKRCEA
jgi:hypothetical protein